MEENNEVVEEVVEEQEESPSIGDELRDAIAAAEEPSEDTVDEPDGAKVATETPQKIPEKEAAPDEGVAEATGVNAPEHWPTGEREKFDALKLSEEAKQLYLESAERLNSHHQKRVEDLNVDAEMLNRLRPLDQELAPYREQFKLQGVNEAEVARQLLAVRTSLQTNPQETIQWLAQSFGVDLDNINRVIDADPTESRLNAIEQNVQQSNQANAQAIQQQQAQAARQTVQTQIDTFSQAKDDAGNLLRPHFENVTETMTGLSHAARAQNKAIDLESIYQEACWMHEPTREKILAARDNTQEATVKKNLRQRTNRAKRADTTIRSSADSPSKSKLSIRDELSQQWEAAPN